LVVNPKSFFSPKLGMGMRNGLFIFNAGNKHNKEIKTSLPYVFKQAKTMGSDIVIPA
jgi:hypothetical protein